MYCELEYNIESILLKNLDAEEEFKERCAGNGFFYWPSKWVVYRECIFNPIIRRIK